MGLKVLALLSAVVASGSLLDARAPTDETDGLIKNLDLTTFPNSVGPRRMQGKTTLADYGFVEVEKTVKGANVVRDDQGWMMGFTIISAGPKVLRVCFYDKGLKKPGDALAPSYNSTTALLVSKKPLGRWTAKQVPAGFLKCLNDPATA
ncbi:hypothetical protein QP185_05805 [Sphingomonas aerolata]|uniref:hypothetical protein n=1 Tax=Sphingomonas aerolata TaxID=185951 RepID=UPI002FE1A648